MRRVILCLPPLLSLCLLLGLFAAPGIGEGERVRRRQPPLVNAAARKVIDAGMRYLIAQQKQDGSWHSNAGKKINSGYEVFKGGRDVPHVGVTGLAVLALLAGGHLPGRGPFGKSMDKAIDFLLKEVRDEDGFIANNKTRMYSHAFATLALAEVFGVSRRPKVREKLELAIEFTVKSQNRTGGWRYVPFTNDSDMSVTVCQIVALRAARNVGIKVPQSTIDRALGYILRSGISREDGSGPAGAYWYQPHDQRFNRDSFALCAAGLTALFQAGLYDDAGVREHLKLADVGRRTNPPRIAESVKYMNEQYWQEWNSNADHYFYFYGNYYGAQAMYQIGGRNPDRWRKWYTRVRDHLLERKHMRADPRTGRQIAYWRSNVDDTNTYATACALLILQFPLDHLPIHQR